MPVLAYRGLWFVFGIRSYVPYQLLVIGGHLVAAALLRVVMRRAGVRPWLATLVALVFVFFGSGAENILIAFQITFVGALVFGLVQLVLADHEGSWDRRDWLGLLAGFAGLMCSGVAIAMTIVVGVAMLLRRGWRIALLHTAPLAIAYAIWSIVSPEGTGAGIYRTQSPLQVVKFMAIGIGSAFGRLGQLPGIGIALAVVMLAGVVWAFREQGLGAVRGRSRCRRRCSWARCVPVRHRTRAIGSARALGQRGRRRPRPRAPEPVRLSDRRDGAAPLALAADTVARRRRWLAIPVVALLVVGVPGNVHELTTYTNQSAVARRKFKLAVLEAPRLPTRESSPEVPSRVFRRSSAGSRSGGSSTACPRGGYRRRATSPRERSRP